MKSVYNRSCHIHIYKFNQWEKTIFKCWLIPPGVLVVTMVLLDVHPLPKEGYIVTIICLPVSRPSRHAIAWVPVHCFPLLLPWTRSTFPPTHWWPYSIPRLRSGTLWDENICGSWFGPQNHWKNSTFVDNSSLLRENCNSGGLPNFGFMYCFHSQ